MTPKRPIELVEASKACARAWLRRDKMIDAGDTVGVDAMNTACDLLQERYNVIYREWQEIGGTSNIDSIALFAHRPFDGRNEIEHAQITATFGKVKVTTSAEWRKRHLHQTAVQVESAKVQAEGLRS